MKVFHDSGIMEQSANFGWQDKNRALFGLREGYKNSADVLVSAAIIDGTPKTLDTYIFPILFSYRHCIEISLKHVYCRCFGQFPKGGHNILDLWDTVNLEIIDGFICNKKKIEIVLKESGKNYTYLINHDDLNKVRILIKEMQEADQCKSERSIPSKNQADQNADVWRYLIDSDEQLYFQSCHSIDYLVLQESISFVYNYIVFLYDIVDDYLSWYKETNPDTHGHFRETELVYPPYSLPSRPFAWMMLRKGNDREDQNIRRLADRYNIDYDPAREPKLAFTTNWLQDAVNQRAIFKTFYENVTPNQSLVIPYAKQVPFIDTSKRVIMGIGFVTSVTEPPEHNHTTDGTLRSILWETMIGHSIRIDRKDGFLLPYQEMMEYAETHPDFDINTVTVFADDEYFEEFSYATEHLSYDAVISVLLQTLKVLDIIKNCIHGNWQECIEWTNARLNEVWIDRGAFPGLGAMLCAVGFKFGVVLANEIKNSINKDDSFEDYV